MPSCAIISCRAKSNTVSRTKGDISFHRFPKEPDIREKWIEATGREDWIPTKTSTICSRHFNRNDYAVKKSGNNYLKHGAYPHENILRLYSFTNEASSSLSTDRPRKDNITEPTHSTDDIIKWIEVQAGGNVGEACQSQLEEKTEHEQSNVPDLVEYAVLDESEPASADAETEPDPRLLNEQALKITLTRIKANPQFYIGIPKNCYHIIDILHKQTRIPTTTILLCLKKVKLDTRFEELADQFGTTPAEATNLFTTNLPTIARTLHTFVNLKRDEPTTKTENTAEIDVLELNVQPNSNRSRELTQTARGNTVKYLIGSADGFINYVSPGYGGKQSNETLLENTDYLKRYKPGDSVIVNGFRNVEHMLYRKGLILKNTGNHSELTKNARSDISDPMRAVQRMREFYMVQDSSIGSESVCVLDEAVVVSCALINLQNFVIN